MDLGSVDGNKQGGLTSVMESVMSCPTLYQSSPHLRGSSFALRFPLCARHRTG